MQNKQKLLQAAVFMLALDSAVEDQTRQLASVEDWMVVDGQRTQLQVACTQGQLRAAVREQVYFSAEDSTKPESMGL